MNLIDNGVEKFISVEKVDDGKRLGWEVTFIDYYGIECKRLVSLWCQVELYQSENFEWVG
jgi:hypothetical protein